MRRAALLVALLGLVACDGAAPPVQAPPALGIITPCTSNAPPPGYQGPVSPYAGSCAPAWTVAPKPAGVHDYSQGQPPRAVR